MPEEMVDDPVEAAILNLNQAQDAPVKKGFVGATLALCGIGYALVAIANEMREANVNESRS